MKNFFVSFVIASVCLLAATSVPLHTQAANTVTPVEVPREELEKLWTDLYGPDPAATNAAIRFFRLQDVAVTFLDEKLLPLKLEPGQCRQLIKELGNKDDAIWKAAWDQLDYLDPRLAIDLTELMAEVREVPARTRMVELCSDRPVDSLAGMDVNIRKVGDDGYNFFAKGSWWAEHRIERIGNGLWRSKRSWTRAARCVAILEQIGSKDAVKVLLKLTSGHPDAFPTKVAKESVLRLKKPAE